ncbi:uncharacterized protein B0I36DRAFT_362060 [Microdochium trichocladiopsis]|uniref:WW domain-containing protein n=1 Tax=Microdochium trichocladiopsis TaxID=1682393 RepID=A0A9P9BRX2_9PEZI|nr:uncharacterized protein B0I36DRAFT_362060 [Microdochium trichocladiopsis]KAH7033386.1 hypothetical protein B0I36DRAFT_362060 [Microdochium trichocladiopsis]
MSTLPEGWEADYDGSRWFYRYKSTGIVQYQFPKEGDEFPEWYDDGGNDVPLEPEAWLASEQQVRRRSTLVSDPENPGELSPVKATTNRRKKSETIPEDEEMSATGYFDPSSFMYLGPGGDISPVGEDDDRDGAGSLKAKSATPTPSPGPTPSTIHSQVSPVPGPPAQIDPRTLAAELPEDTAHPWKPVGFVAELPTLDTVKCAEELAPVEMDGTSHIPTPVQTKQEHSGPVELPTHREPAESKAKEPTPPANTLPVVTPPVQTLTEYPLVSASFAYPALQPQSSGGSTPSRHQSPAQVQSSAVSTPPMHQSPQQSPLISSSVAVQQRITRKRARPYAR